MLIVKENCKVLLPLERQGLLGAYFRACREKECGDAPRSRQRVGGSCEIRRLNIIDIDIGDFYGLGLELSAEASTVESSTENRGFVRIDVQCDLFTTKASDGRCSIGQGYTYTPTAALTAA